MDLMTGLVDVLEADERSQLDAFLSTYRGLLRHSLDGLSEVEARQRLVPSGTTLLGLVKHATYVERVWFGEAVQGRSRAELGVPADMAETHVLTDGDTIATVLAGHAEAVATSEAVAAGLALDDVVTGHRFGPMNLRWIHLHLVRELAQHCGHADILREQVLADRED